jgi:outer membrane receptor protein involved in Fe transport
MLAAISLAASFGTGAAETGSGSTRQSQQLDEVVVFGRAEQQIGTADAASEGTVGGADLSVRPMLRVAELLEAVPGMIAAQHSGSGKANQYFLRGFNLDHGTDFTTYIDGMPWNLRSHGHGQGYLDVNGLIPEVVDRIDYRKGPYRADVGDFALAGSSFMTTIDRLDAPFVSAEVGQYGWRRLAGGGTTTLGPGELTGVLQLKTYDGPWQEPEDLKHGSMWAKYLQPIGDGMLQVTLSGYHATWHPTEQSPEIAVGSPECPDRFCSLDQTAFGKTDRWILTANYELAHWTTTAYAQRYDWHMLSDPTYDYQIRQFDHRWTFGGRTQRKFLEGQPVELLVGSELRYDDASRVGVDHTDAAVFALNLANNSIREGSIAGYSEATWHATDKLRLNAGLRADHYHFSAAANAGAAAETIDGRASDNQLSPKAGLAWSVSNDVEVYANWGRGFHSNDARGVVNPDPDAQVPGLVHGTGKEGGIRFERSRWNLTATYWWLDVSSELIFVGDSNAVEPKSGGKRRGLELVAFWKPFDWLGIDAVYTHSHARYKELQDDPPVSIDLNGVETPSGLQGYFIEGSVESAGELGISAVRGQWEASGRLRYLGPYPLVPSGTRRAHGESMINMRLAYKFGSAQLYGELLNVLDDKGDDVRYYYPTYYPGITAPDAQTSTYLSRAEEPRTLRVGIKYSF